MKLFHFHDPGNNLFAKASRRGTWYPPGIKICPECSSSRQTRISPLIIEWEAGSDKIGDFTWPGFDTELVVVNTVKIAFKNKFTKIEFGVVTFFQNQNLRQPIKLTSRTKPRIWLPYPGPMLWDILPTHWCHIDHSKSGVSIEKKMFDM